MQHIIYKMAILVVAFSFFGCGNKEKKSAEAKMQNEIKKDDRIYISKAQFEHSKMTVGRLEEKPFPKIVKTNGVIDVPPENRAVINATMGGYIKTTPFLIGDKVRKGQVLVTIENSEFVTLQQNYMEVNEQLTYLKSEYDRQKIMIAENITSQKNFLKAESIYKTALARHRGLRKKLSLLNISLSDVENGNMSSVISIYSSIAGSITKVNVTRGAYVSPATSIMEIIDNSHIHLELSVFEKDIMKLKKGQEINFRIPEISMEWYDAEVYLIGTAIEENRTIKVHGHIENESEVNFLTGMFVEADIFTDLDFAIALPETAIVAFEDTFFVLLLEEENDEGYFFKQVAVEVGKTYEGYGEIITSERIKAADKVLTKGAFNLVVNE